MNIKLSFKSLFFFVFIAVVVQNISAQNDSIKSKEFDLYGYKKHDKNIEEVIYKKDTIHHSFWYDIFHKYKNERDPKSKDYNYLIKYKSGLFEANFEKADLRGVFEDFIKETGRHFTFVGSIDVKTSLHIESFDIDNLIDEICYQNDMLAVKEQNRYIIYGVGAGKILGEKEIIYQYAPRNTSADDIMDKANNLDIKADLKEMQDQNMVLISGKINEIKDAIYKLRLLDKEPKKVSIELLVVEYNHGKNFNWDFNVTSGQQNRISNLSYKPTNGVGFTYNFLSKLSPSFKFNLQALVANNYANVVTNPHIMVLNKKEANIDVTQSRYVKLQTANLNGVSTNLQQINAGVTLQVTPTIMAEGLLELDISGTNSIFLPDGIDGTINTFDQTINTNVMVRNGQTLIIGGLIQARESASKGGVPFLRNIPLLGLLFRNKTKTKNYIETVIYITPYMEPLKNKDLQKTFENSKKIEKKLKKNSRKTERKGILKF